MSKEKKKLKPTAPSAPYRSAAYRKSTLKEKRHLNKRQSRKWRQPYNLVGV